jgi:hypothetical protein
MKKGEKWYEKVRLINRRLPKYRVTGAIAAHLPTLEGHKGRTGLLSLDEKGNLFIGSGYMWDGPSGPTFDTENWMMASVIHDALCDLVRYGGLDPVTLPEIHNIMRQYLLDGGMSKARAWWSWKAVQLFGNKFVEVQ